MIIYANSQDASILRSSRQREHCHWSQIHVSSVVLGWHIPWFLGNRARSPQLIHKWQPLMLLEGTYAFIVTRCFMCIPSEILQTTRGRVVLSLECHTHMKTSICICICIRNTYIEDKFDISDTVVGNLHIWNCNLHFTHTHTHNYNWSAC